MTKLAILKSGIANTGGLEKYTRKIAEALAAKGADVHLLTTGEESITSLPPEVKIVNFGKLPKLSLYRLWRYDQLVKQWIHKNEPSIVLGMDRNTFQTHYRAGNGVHAAYLDRRSKVDPYFKRLSFQFNPLHRSILHFEKETYENPSLQLLVANSNMVKEELLQHYKVKPEIIEVLHNGVEWHELAADFNVWDKQQVEVCRELGLDPSHFQFLFVGNGYQRKGLSYLLEGLSRIKWRNFQLSVVGYDKDIGKFQRMAADLKLEERVKFFGVRRDLVKFYQAVDALVIPSLYDPFANVTLEALAMGVFVISSRYNGGSEILTPQNGVIIDDLFDRESVAVALQKGAEHTKTPHSAQNIRNSVKNHDFNIQLEKLIRKILT